MFHISLYRVNQAYNRDAFLVVAKVQRQGVLLHLTELVGLGGTGERGRFAAGACWVC